MTTDVNNDQAQNTEKVTFTPEQQAKISEIVAEAQARVAREVGASKTQLENSLRQAMDKVAELESQVNSVKSSDGSEASSAREAELKNLVKKAQDDLKAFQSIAKQNEEQLKSAKEENINIRREVAISSATADLGFMNPQMVADYTSKFVRWDEGKARFIVVNEQGTERINSSFEPMSLKEFYTEFAAKNPWMVRSDARGGSGATGSDKLSSNGKYEVGQVFGPKSDAGLANRLKKESPQEYARLKAIAKENGLIS